MKAATRSLVAGLAFVSILTAASVLGVLSYASHAAHASDLTHLSEVHEIAARLQDDRLALLRLRADTLAGDPSFVDYMAQSLTPNPAQGNAIDTTSIIDLLDQDRHGYDLAIVLDPDGREVAASGLLLSRTKTLQGDPLVKQVIATRKPASGLWVDDGRVLQIVVEPLLRGGALQGELLIARELGRQFITEVSGLVRAGVALVELPRQASQPLLFTDAAPWLTATLGGLKPPAKLPATGRALRLVGDGHRTWAWISPIGTTSGTAVLVTYQPHSSTSVTGMAWPLLSGVLALALISTVVVVWYRRRVALPLQALAEIIERGALGDRRLRAKVGGSPAVQRLRDAVNRLFEHDEAADAAGGRPHTHH